MLGLDAGATYFFVIASVSEPMRVCFLPALLPFAGR